MKSQREKEIAQRLDKRTPGLWMRERVGGAMNPDDAPQTNEIIAFEIPSDPHDEDVERKVCKMRSAADVEFIVHAPADVAWLLRRLAHVAQLLETACTGMENGWGNPQVAANLRITSETQLNEEERRY
jgi:hypothetical protein